jgi:predicted dehydrogenase
LGAENGSCRLYSEDRDGFELALGDPYATHPTWATHLPRALVPPSYRTTGACIPDFVLAIRHKLRDYPSFEDALVVQNVLEGIARSARTNRWEKV